MSVPARSDTAHDLRPLDERVLTRTGNGALDSIFRSAPSGRLPAGVLRGTVLLFPGSPACRLVARLAYRIAWQGKVVAPSGEGLVNRITPFRLRLVRARVARHPSWVDDRPCVVIDYSTTSVVARMVRDETREVAPGLHLGVVWLWRRRVAWFALRATARR